MVSTSLLSKVGSPHAEKISGIYVWDLTLLLVLGYCSNHSLLEAHFNLRSTFCCAIHSTSNKGLVRWLDVVLAPLHGSAEGSILHSDEHSVKLNSMHVAKRSFGSILRSLLIVPEGPAPTNYCFGCLCPTSRLSAQRLARFSERPR